MATVFDVANYILQKKGDMTTMKLQKLAYYCQAWSLAWDGVPLFDEDFEAWANGPVCVELFNTHRGRFLIDKNFYRSKASAEFTKAQKETMDIVLKDYGDERPNALSNLSHSERPWKIARKGVPVGVRCNNIISKDEMQEYYGGLASGEEAW